MHEFQLITAFREVAGGEAGDGLLLGAGDDAALLEPPVGEVLAVSVDTALEGRHFPAHSPGDLVGWRALAMNLSDLAAMGASPWCAFLALTIPDADVNYVRALARGWRALARPHGLLLAGGNLTRGQLSLTVTVIGLLPAGAALTRSAAAVGDQLWVSGEPGLAASGLAMAGSARGLDDLAHPALARYWAPEPRLALGIALRGIASACIDISDGLAADAGHLAAASAVEVNITLEQLPGSGDPRAALTGGDDYELCFTAPARQADSVQAAAVAAGTPVTCIGHIRDGDGVRVSHHGEVLTLPQTGYRHF